MKSGAAEEEKPALAIASLLFLGLNVVAYGAIAVHTLLSRRRYVKFAEDWNVQGVARDIFLFTPGPVYAAAFLLLVVCLLVKEVAIENKTATLRINLAALAAALLLFIVFLGTIQLPFEERLRG